MGTKPISSIKLSDTLTLAECKDGFWLHDATRGMNLAISVKTPEAAFVEALMYYQKRLTEVETTLKELQTKVNSFLNQFKEDEESDW